MPWFSLLEMAELGTLVLMELDLRSQQDSALWTKRVRSSLGHVTCWETVFTGSRGERPWGRCDWLSWVCWWLRGGLGRGWLMLGMGEGKLSPPGARRCLDLGSAEARCLSRPLLASLPAALPPLLHLFFSPFHVLSHPLSSLCSSFPSPPSWFYRPQLMPCSWPHSSLKTLTPSCRTKAQVVCSQPRRSGCTEAVIFDFRKCSQEECPV